MSGCSCEWISDGIDGGGGAASSRASYVLPEVWGQENVAANQAAVALGTQVSINFDTFKAIVGGSITGVLTRLTEAVTAGTMRVHVTINGVASGLTVQSTNAANQSGGVSTAAFGVIPYVAGDLIGATVTTDAGFLPITTDLEVTVKVTE